jgi:hypothetical protein
MTARRRLPLLSAALSANVVGMKAAGTRRSSKGSSAGR